VHDIEVDPDARGPSRSGTTATTIIPTDRVPRRSHLSEPTNEELAEKIGLERMATSHVYDLIVIGGGPAGLTTSIYAARETCRPSSSTARASAARRASPSASTTTGLSGRHRRGRAGRPHRPAGEALRRRGMLQAVSVTSISTDGEEVDVETATGDHYHARAR
jgi:glycine/D-amino acid oxidase-like deaminating enzyme